jgi:adenylate kinase
MKKKPLYLVLIGASGSGKGIQAKLIAKDHHLVHISSGDVFRQEVAKKTSIGKKISQYLKKGQWVPEETICKMIFPRLKEAFETGFVLDGSPRTISQAKIIDDFLDKNGKKLDLVILIRVKPEVVLARREKVVSIGKKFQPGRNDDNPQTFKKRFDSYLKTIRPILNYYHKKNILVEIDGERPVEKIYKDIKKELEKI